MSSPAIETVRTIPLVVENRIYDLEEPTDEDGGFPFEEGAEKDREHPFRSQLDDLAKRHPEFAEHLSFGESFPFRSSLRDRFRREADPSPSGSPGRSTRQDPFEEYRRRTDRPFGSRFERFPFGRSFDEPEFGHVFRGTEQGQSPQPSSQQPSQQEEVKVEVQKETPKEEEKKSNLAQSNTVDLGQKQEPVDETRNQRSMSAPPDNRNAQQRFVSSCSIPINRDGGGDSMGAKPSAQTTQKQEQTHQQNRSNERVIPIHVEGRDEPIIPKNVHQTFRAASPKPRPPQPQAQQQQHHQEKPTQQQQPPQPPEQPSQEQQQQQLRSDQIDKIQSIQKDVIELMNQVEKFDGKYRDKQYLYLDEMLTRNLIKLDNIDTEGKDNIRQARREAIRCIEKCISILETKAKQCETPNGEKMETEVNNVGSENNENKKVAEENPQPMEVEPSKELEVSGVSRSGTEANVPQEQKMEVENTETRAVLVTAPLAPAEETMADEVATKAEEESKAAVANNTRETAKEEKPKKGKKKDKTKQ